MNHIARRLVVRIYRIRIIYNNPSVNQHPFSVSIFCKEYVSEIWIAHVMEWATIFYLLDSHKTTTTLHIIEFKEVDLRSLGSFLKMEYVWNGEGG